VKRLTKQLNLVVEPELFERLARVKRAYASIGISLASRSEVVRVAIERHIEYLLTLQPAAREFYDASLAPNLSIIRNKTRQGNQG
jgi:hypothetical protein